MSTKKGSKKIKTLELFAGVGGFRLGLEGWNGKSSTSGYQEDLNSNYEVVFSNQWEPSTKVQHASMVYENRWGKDGHTNIDITTLETDLIPDHDLLVGGFPCQDYSVATTLKNSKGLIGKKGVLWWSIHNILSDKKNPPKYLFLENVDRLLISPSKQRGRDFAIILKSLDELDYVVEWRIVNAAEYGFPQRRKRIFILGYKKGTNLYKELIKNDPLEYILNTGVLAESLPVALKEKTDNLSIVQLSEDIVDISDNFNKDMKFDGFQNAGIMVKGKVYSIKTKSNYDGDYTLLGDIIQKDKVGDEYYIDKDSIDKWEYLKGAKKEIRKNSDGFEYHYSEGGMIFPDPLDKPSRTIITGEGGKSPSRFKHVINTKKGKRRLTPIELERLNMFPDNHTNLEGINDTKRAFFMGNALVVGVIECISKQLMEKILR
jgi:DNA (cytosine-5)-methyltransferase 1